MCAIGWVSFIGVRKLRCWSNWKPNGGGESAKPTISVSGCSVLRRSLCRSFSQSSRLKNHPRCCGGCLALPLARARMAAPPRIATLLRYSPVRSPPSGLPSSRVLAARWNKRRRGTKMQAWKLGRRGVRPRPSC